MKRRNFIKKASATGLGLMAASSIISCEDKKAEEKVIIKDNNPVRPLVIATWNTPLAVETAAKVLEKGIKVCLMC